MIHVGMDLSGIDPAFKSHAQRGIGRYVLELSRAIQARTDEGVAVGFFDHASLIQGGFGAHAIDLLPCGRTTLRQQLLYPFRLNSGETRCFDFLHFPAHMDAPAWSNKPFVLTVLDLIPLVLSDLYRANKPGWRFRFARWLEIQAIKQAVVLLAISDHTAQDVSRILDIPRDRIVVTPLGVDDSFFEVEQLRRARRQRDPHEGAESGLRQRLGIPKDRPIVLYVGGHDERKNITALIQIGARVRSERIGQNLQPPVLVLAGRITSPLEQARLDGALDTYDMRGDTVFLGYVPDEDLRELYAEATLFLFPSLYEGFGLPVLEAMASGLPVVSSNASAMPEVVGDAGALFAPEDIESGCRAVLSILSDQAKAQAFEEQGRQRARLFTWDETARTTIEGYRLAASLLAQGGKGGRNSSGPGCSPTERSHSRGGTSYQI